MKSPDIPGRFNLLGVAGGLDEWSPDWDVTRLFEAADAVLDAVGVVGEWSDDLPTPSWLRPGAKAFLYGVDAPRWCTVTDRYVTEDQLGEVPVASITDDRESGVEVVHALYLWGGDPARRRLPGATAEYRRDGTLL
ncbi:hypothetical protein [Luteipulveratus halotolerans]|uniref:Uncharacterized protein n=1 Tax=Luteipulveratus halotolerans TaxID=1631356 RepID=A0A0L6CEZ9_9MICO|nr:hypothetical protein [Luteipulveratus halotolerans]KNX36078.1 hypothetical protein VV01_01210 [Luteipulveratus halotolerans]